MRLLPRFTVVAGLIAGMLAVSTLPVEAQTPTPTATATTTSTATPLVVQAGSGEAGYAINLFGPNKVTVPVGATVGFKTSWFEPHTVTFLGGRPTPPPSDPTAPVPSHPGQVIAYDGTQYVSSGFITSRSPVWQISFPKAGTYPFLCIIHPGMNGTVEVSASAAATTQAQADAGAQQVFSAALPPLKAEAAKLAAKPVTQTTNADGTTTYRVNTVGGYVPPSDVQQFFPAGMNVRVGDTVVFESTVPTPHTVTFLGGTPMPFPPSLEDPKIFGPTPAPGAGYDGTGYVNSGVIGVGFPGQTFSVKFSKAGNFPFICILHVDQGMGGTINVAAAQVTPPKTGSAGMLTTESATVAAALALVAAALLAGTRVLSGRTR